MEQTTELPEAKLPGDRIVAKHRTIFSSLPMHIFMIHAVKKPLMMVAGLILDKLPEPTKANTDPFSSFWSRERVNN